MFCGKKVTKLPDLTVHIKSTTVYAPRRNWVSPNPLLASECSPPPRNRGGGGTLACGWGVGGSPNSDEGHTLWYSLYVHTLCTLGIYLDGYASPKDDLCCTCRMGWILVSSFFLAVCTVAASAVANAST
jgi:hypothetical protein